MSRERLAWQSGVSLTTVARLEREPRPRCQKRTLALLADALGEHPDTITAPDPAGRRQVEPGAAADGAADRLCEVVPEPPWSCSRTFPARPEQVGRAREFLGRVLAGYPVTADIVLICSELATNTVRHSNSAASGGRFRLRAEVREGDYAWIEVEDLGGRWAPGENPDRVTGRDIVGSCR